MKRWFLIGLVAVAFALFVWPTPFQYMATERYVIKINRFTGSMSATPVTWVVEEQGKPMVDNRR